MFTVLTAIGNAFSQAGKVKKALNQPNSLYSPSKSITKSTNAPTLSNPVSAWGASVSKNPQTSISSVQKLFNPQYPVSAKQPSAPVQTVPEKPPGYVAPQTALSSTNTQQVQERVPPPQNQNSAQNQYLRDVQTSADTQRAMAERQRQEKEAYIREKYGSANAALESAIPEYQNQFNQFKGNTEATIADFLASGEREKSRTSDYYGEAQRLAAKNRRDVSGQIQRTFANLGTLDSRGEGSFQQATENADTEFNRFTEQTLRDRADKLSEIDSLVAQKEREARSAIVSEESKMRGLISQIRTAQANNRLDETQSLLEAYNEAQQNIYNITDSVNQLKYQAGLEQEKLNNSLAELQAKASYGDPAERVKSESTLRNEFFTRTKDNQYNQVYQNYQKILNSPDNASGDLGMIFAYMKLLDPSSTVREGEFANAQNATGVPARILNLYNQAISGQRLNPQQRSEFKSSAGAYAKPVLDQQRASEQYYSDLARQQGLDPRNVIGGYSTIGGMVGDSSLVRVRDRSTGQTGTIPANEFDQTLYERI